MDLSNYRDFIESRDARTETGSNLIIQFGQLQSENSALKRALVDRNQQIDRLETELDETRNLRFGGDISGSTFIQKRVDQLQNEVAFWRGEANNWREIALNAITQLQEMLGIRS